MSTSGDQSRRSLFAAGGLGVLALLAAGGLQRWFGFDPCPWCTLQRLLCMIAVVLALSGAMARPGALRKAGAGLALLTALAGASAALYQHFVASHSDACSLTLADRIMGTLGLPDLWPAMFEATARCDEANRPFLGLPFALWSAALFVALAALCLTAVLSRPRSSMFSD